MRNVVRQITSFLLPITVLILIPLYIEGNISIKYICTLIPGLVIILIGLTIMTLTIASFAKLGKGTLAPWSPTKKLVIVGMYRYVRNPMIIGVLIVLLGESISILSLRIFIWAMVFFILNSIHFVLYEEPNLEKRFGDEYKEYKKNVPRWIPRLKPFKP